MQTNQKLDIHDFLAKEQREFEKINESSLSDANKKLLIQYSDFLTRIGNHAPRRIKELITMRCFAERIQNDYEKVSKEEIEAFITRLTKNRENEKISIWTQYDYQKIIKKFYKWLATQGKSNVDVSWIKGRIPKKDIPHLDRAEFLLEEDIKKLIQTQEDPRDQAFIALLWDYGARISEVGNLRWKDIEFDAAGGIHSKLAGKTGTRNVWALKSVPYLKRWLAISPHKQPDDPIWLANDRFKKKFTNQAMSYSGLYRVLVKAFQKSGLTTFEKITFKTNPKEKYRYVRKGGKKVNPHLFRHSRALWAALNGWTNQVANVFFGWAPDSNMFAYYVSMVEDDAKRKMMECIGMVDTNKQPTPKCQYCPTCQLPNNPAEQYCTRCQCLLDLEAYQKQQEKMALSIAGFVTQQVMNNIGRHDLSAHGAQNYKVDVSTSGGQTLFYEKPVGAFITNPNWLQCDKCKQHHAINEAHTCGGK